MALRPAPPAGAASGGGSGGPWLEPRAAGRLCPDADLCTGPGPAPCGRSRCWVTPSVGGGEAVSPPSLPCSAATMRWVPRALCTGGAELPGSEGRGGPSPRRGGASLASTCCGGSAEDPSVGTSGSAGALTCAAGGRNADASPVRPRAALSLCWRTVGVSAGASVALRDTTTGSRASAPRGASAAGTASAVGAGCAVGGTSSVGGASSATGGDKSAGAAGTTTGSGRGSWRTSENTRDGPAGRLGPPCRTGPTGRRGAAGAGRAAR